MVEQALGDSKGDAGLADAAGADDRDEAAGQGLGGHRLDHGGAPDQTLQTQGQVQRQRGRGGVARRPGEAAYRGDQDVAAAGDGVDVVAPVGRQGLAQG